MRMRRAMASSAVSLTLNAVLGAACMQPTSFINEIHLFPCKYAYISIYTDKPARMHTDGGAGAGAGAGWGSGRRALLPVSAGGARPGVKQPHGW